MHQTVKPSFGNREGHLKHILKKNLTKHFN